MFGYILAFAAGTVAGGGLMIVNQKSVKRAAEAARRQAIYDCEKLQQEKNAAYRRGVCDRKEGRRGRWDDYDA